VSTSAHDAEYDPVHLGWPRADGPFVAVVDRWIRELPAAQTFLAEADDVYVLPGRPTIAAADQISDLVTTRDIGRIVSAGAGLVIDVVKLAIFRLRARSRSGAHLHHAAIPCGPEPYRAVAPFSMFEGPPGERASVWEEWLRPNEVAVVPELLAHLDPAVVELFCGDSLVHAVESALTKLSSSDSERYALAATNAFVEHAAARAVSWPDLVLASIAAARAFDITKLGLAHALSRPLGIAAAASHDSFNLMLGTAVVNYWGSDVLADSALARVERIEPDANVWAALIDGYRARAGLPQSLVDAGITWRDAETAIQWAPHSSGIPNLPRQFDPDAPRLIISAAWGRQSERLTDGAVM
jgi:alcohol dehydrogenase class IV